MAALLRSHAQGLQAEAGERVAAAQASRVVRPASDPDRSVGLVIAIPSVQELLHSALSRWVSHVLVAGDPVPGLGLAIAEQPDIVLIADRLPTLSGLDIGCLMRVYAPDTRVVLFTDDRRSRQVASLEGIVTRRLSHSRRRLDAAVDQLLAA